LDKERGMRVCVLILTIAYMICFASSFILEQ
jgi:hypothetical protein